MTLCVGQPAPLAAINDYKDNATLSYVCFHLLFFFFCLTCLHSHHLLTSVRKENELKKKTQGRHLLDISHSLSHTSATSNLYSDKVTF